MAAPTKLFFGSLPPSCTQSQLEEIASPYGQVTNVHIMTRQAASGAICAFVEMASHEQAKLVIEALNGRVTMPPHHSPITVSFANTQPRGVAGGPPVIPKLFVGNLPGDITETVLEGIFKQYGKLERIVMVNKPSPSGNRSAFAVYQSVDECKYAIQCLDGKYSFPGSTDTMVVRFADSASGQRSGYSQQSSSSQPEVRLFVGNLPDTCTQEQLVSFMSTYGQVTNSHLMTTPTPSGAICAFIEYADAAHARAAIQALDGIYPFPPRTTPMTVSFAKVKNARGSGDNWNQSGGEWGWGGDNWGQTGGASNWGKGGATPAVDYSNPAAYYQATAAAWSQYYASLGYNMQTPMVPTMPSPMQWPQAPSAYPTTAYPTAAPYGTPAITQSPWPTTMPGYPQTGVSTTMPGYPQTGSSTAMPGYPQAGASTSVPGYPQTAAPTTMPGYPQAGSWPQIAAPQTMPAATDASVTPGAPPALPPTAPPTGMPYQSTVPTLPPASMPTQMERPRDNGQTVTLLLTNLPPEYNETAVASLFQMFPGYLGSQVHLAGDGSSASANATFSSAETARAAQASMNDFMIGQYRLSCTIRQPGPRPY